MRIGVVLQHMITQVSKMEDLIVCVSQKKT